MINKADDYLIKKFTEVYLWILDWTGIYLSTVCVALIVIGNLVGTGDKISLVFALMNILILIPMYHKQNTGNYIAMNAEAMFIQNFLFRRVFTLFLAIMIVVELITLDWKGLVNSCAYFIYFYMLCVCVREREPKKFEKRVLATQRMSS